MVRGVQGAVPMQKERPEGALLGDLARDSPVGRMQVAGDQKDTLSQGKNLCRGMG